MIYLKGITQAESIETTQELNLAGYGFDLRPKSFNFVQVKKVKDILGQYPNFQYILLFENEKEFMVNDLFELIQEDNDYNLTPEFTGLSNLSEIEKVGKEFYWHYHDEETFKNLQKHKLLKKIIFLHQDLEDYHARGELFGFLTLFKDLQTAGIKFEVQIDWDTSIIESMFEYFPFDTISYEINNKVELSYQNPNHAAIISQLINTKNLFS